MEELIHIENESDPINAIIDHAKTPTSILIIAHGAGAPMYHSFMKKLANSIQEMGVTTVRFNFPYMDKGKKFPGNPKANIAAWLNVFNWIKNRFDLPVFISGKSYGGRMASHLIEENKELNVKGLIYFGFPLHAPGKPSKDRARHLKNITIPQLFLQGTNDTLANIELISNVVSSMSHAQFISYEGADHSFKTKGIKLDDTIANISLTTSNWINGSI